MSTESRWINRIQPKTTAHTLAKRRSIGRGPGGFEHTSLAPLLTTS
jgi:hypothetical protein